MKDAQREVIERKGDMQIGKKERVKEEKWTLDRRPTHSHGIR